uniref:hypothetical protein n=1 Tax=Trichocoleus desertorum TaxID=1481672 RepID=UPI0025B503C6|nr:hypothetical protein [Trichocoleus desertorum]
MRYSIMLQLVVGIGTILVTAAALFAWIQNRSVTPQQTTRDDVSLHLGSYPQR